MEHEPTESRRTTTTPQIVLVDQHTILRDGLAALLNTSNQYEVIAEADSVAAARRIIDRLLPDLVITEIELEKESAISLISWLEQSHPDIRPLVLSSVNSQDRVQAALDAGAAGYVLKDATKSELLSAIGRVLAGRQFVSSEVAARAIAGMFGHRGETDGPGAQRLTARERQVLTMVALANSTKAIAARLNLSVKTVEKHRANIVKKLELENPAAVTLYAVRHGLIQVDASSDGEQAND